MSYCQKLKETPKILKFKIKPVIIRRKAIPMSGNPRILTQREKRYFDHADYRLQTDSGRLHVYTDGSTIGNGRKNARGGYGVFFGHPEIPYISRDLNSSKVTNNTAELKAIIEALKVISKLDQSDVIIHYDSEYAAGVITGQKQAHKNLDLVNEGKDLLRTLSHKVIKFEHVYSHTGHLDLHSIGNEIADDLARRRPGQAPIL